MARTDEAEIFFVAVYQAVREVPEGKVTTYGHIAKLIGYPQRPRQVGVCLKHLPNESSEPFNSDNVPWQRVINAQGQISAREAPGARHRQADALRAEGIDVEQGSMGELKVSLAEYGWFPEVLPSEEDEEIYGHASVLFTRRNVACTSTMNQRTGESPMDFEWQSGTNDPSSPFRTAASQTPARKRPFSVFESPNKPSVPKLTEPASQTFLFSTPQKNLFTGSSFTTPRHFDEVFSSGAETSPPNDADGEETPEAKTLRGLPSTKKDTSLVLKQPAGRGEIKKTKYTDLVARRIQKRRFAQRRMQSVDVDSDDENSANAKSEQGLIGSVLSWIEAHPQLPHVLSFYVQLFLNLSLVVIFLYLLYSFWATIRSDVDKRSQEVAAEALSEMASCAKSFVDNRCERTQRVPAMDKICNEWETCMNRNPDAVGRARVSAHTFAEIFNSFIEPISWKAMVFATMITTSCFIVSNLAFNIFRTKTTEQQQPQFPVHPYPMTPHSHLSYGYDPRTPMRSVQPSASRKRLAWN